MIILHLASCVQYWQPHGSPVQYATCYTRHLCRNVQKIMVNVNLKLSEFNESILVIDANHSFFCILNTTFQHPPLFLFKYSVFDITCSVRDVSGCILLCDVNLVCNKP